MKEVVIFLSAAGLDLLFGDPHFLKHPVSMIGAWISFGEKKLRKHLPHHLYGAGFLLFLSTILVSLGVIFFIQWGLSRWHEVAYEIFLVYGLYTAFAGRCLADEAHRVRRILKEKGLEKGRKELSYLVGRDTGELTENDVKKALLETTAENTIDGVLGPLFYMVIGFLIGYPLLTVYLYKAVNTLDSMVGYQNEKYGKIGFFSAKADDVLNFLPARMGSLIMLLSGGLLGLSLKRGLKIFIRDRKNHKSPNAGHPESVMAGLLGIQLGGDSTYFGQRVTKKTLGEAEEGNLISDAHIQFTIRVMYLSFAISLLIGSLIIWSVCR